MSVLYHPIDEREGSSSHSHVMRVMVVVGWALSVILKTVLS